jgi:hypothetical protein
MEGQMDKSQLFLLLVWSVTLSALLACIYLMRDIKSVSTSVKQEAKENSFVVPPSGDRAPNRTGFTVPPPPF